MVDSTGFSDIIYVPCMLYPPILVVVLENLNIKGERFYNCTSKPHR